MAKSPSRTRIAKTDRRSDLRRAGLGTRIELNENEAKTVRRIFKWAADGVGVGTMVERLNNEGVPRPSGKRWTKSPISRILNNERYLGRQIWGQRSVEHEPGTGRIITRPNPRTAWKVQERPELRIVSDELWNRAQETRAEIRKAVAPKRNLARGKDARFHSKHLLTGFGTCQVCGGAMSSVSGGKGSPRLGCRRSWAEGRSACPNRLTIRIRVAEPQILARLQGELLKSAVTAYITKAVEKEIRKSLGRSRSPKGVRRSGCWSRNARSCRISSRRLKAGRIRRRCC
jgi:site-specific DNA recombinase